MKNELRNKWDIETRSTDIYGGDCHFSVISFWTLQERRFGSPKVASPGSPSPNRETSANVLTLRMVAR